MTILLLILATTSADLADLRGAEGPARAACRGLVQKGAAAVSDVAPLLQDASPIVRERAISVLAQIGEPRAAQALLDALVVAPPAERKSLLSALAGHRALEVPPILAALGRSGEAGGDRVALLEIALRKTHASANEATALLESQLARATAFELRVRIVRALGAAATEAAEKRLASVARSDPDEIVRAEAIGQLAPLSGERASAALHEGVTDRSPRVRDAAVLALGRREDPRRVASLRERLERDPWTFVRRDAAEALGIGCPPEGRASLRTAVSTEREDEDVRRAAMASLVACKDAEAPVLLQTIVSRSDDDPSVRAAACSMVGAFPSALDVKRIAETIDQASGRSAELDRVALACLRTLGRLAHATIPNADAAAHVLTATLEQGKSETARAAAARALGGICTPSVRSELGRAAKRDQSLTGKEAKRALAACQP